MTKRDRIKVDGVLYEAVGDTWEDVDLDGLGDALAGEPKVRDGGWDVRVSGKQVTLSRTGAHWGGRWGIREEVLIDFRHGGAPTVSETVSDRSGSSINLINGKSMLDVTPDDLPRVIGEVVNEAEEDVHDIILAVPSPVLVKIGTSPLAFVSAVINGDLRASDVSDIGSAWARSVRGLARLVKGQG